MSDPEQASSPVPEERSFAPQSITEDEDTKIDVPPDKIGNRGKSRGSHAQQHMMNTTIGKIRHLKKEDGEPLWRKDIQFDFLKAVFENTQAVFTSSYELREKQCFADLYIDTMARSSKTSKVLRDKLMSDRDAAKGMAMVCLLVNIGRMNTTLNCESIVWGTHCPSLTTLADHPASSTSVQSFLKCALSCGRIMRSRPSKPTKIPMHTSSYRTLPGSSQFSKGVPRTAPSPTH